MYPRNSPEIRNLTDKAATILRYTGRERRENENRERRKDNENNKGTRSV